MADQDPDKHPSFEATAEKVIQKAAELPVAVVEQGGKAVKAVVNEKNIKKATRRTSEYWRLLGPGLTTGAADDDPSGIATYSQTGAQYGFQLLWLAPFTFVLMGVVQEMCARIGMVTGRGLAGMIRRRFSKRVLYACTVLLILANTLNIGADLGAMAQAVQLLQPQWNFGLLVIGFALLSLFLQIALPYQKYSKVLKIMALTLLAYFATAFLANLNWIEVIRHTVVPTITFSKDQLILICAILGTTISPYLFFWQTSQEVEEQIDQGKTSIKLRAAETTQREIRNMRIDNWSGMLFSNLSFFFIVAVCGGVLFTHGITDIQSSRDAATALRPLAGDAAFQLFAFGVVGVGLLGIPVLAGSSSYAFAESLKLRAGLSRKLNQARAFYGVLILSVLVGMLLNFMHIDPIKALIYSAVANGIVAPIILVCIVIISSDKKIMGEWVNKKPITAIGWITTIVMAIAGIAAIVALFL